MAKHQPALSLSATNPFGNAPRRRKGRERRRAILEALPLGTRLKVWLQGHHWGRVALLLETVLSLAALLSLHLLPDKISLRVGELSTQEIRASRTVQYPDQNATRALRDAAAARVDPVYSPIRYAFPEADQTLGDVYAHLRRARGQAGLSASRVAGELRQQVGVVVAPSLLVPLLRDKSPAFHLDQARRATEAAVHDAMDRDLRDDHAEDLAQARAAVSRAVALSHLPSDYVPGVAALARAVVHPNRHLDERLTQKAREAERQFVSMQLGQVFAGDIVVRRGEIVTPETIDKLRALGLQNPRLNPLTVLSVTLLVAMMVGLTVVYLARHQKPVFASTKTLVLLSILVVLSVLSLKLSGSVLGVRLSPSQFGYIGMLCVAAGAMLIAALIHPRIAMLVTALLAAQSGLILGNDLRFALMTLLSGLVAIYTVSDIRSRSDVVRAAATLCAANVFLSLVVGGIQGDLAYDMRQGVVWAFFAGVLAVALFSIGAALFERAFGITTHLGLLELSDPNRPLLQKFCQIAPGTYTHSIMVGNLAVVAAEAIGADALLCRVGAYYHDIGKMLRAEFFIENQAGGDNVHTRLNPSLSALVVTAHVKDGLEIAAQQNLPPIIRSFITEHHGTSLIRYFYHQQTGGEGGEAGLEQHFRYGGPKPQSRETAILMLSDGVEAASRTLDKPTVGRITDLVDKIINAQLADGQLDECDLTLRDLRGIRDAFIRLLSGMLHTRIEYPNALRDQKADKNGTADPCTIPASSPLALPGGQSADTASADTAAA